MNSCRHNNLIGVLWENVSPFLLLWLYLFFPRSLLHYNQLPIFTPLDFTAIIVVVIFLHPINMFPTTLSPSFTLRWRSSRNLPSPTTLKQLLSTKTCWSRGVMSLLVCCLSKDVWQHISNMSLWIFFPHCNEWTALETLGHNSHSGCCETSQTNTFLDGFLPQRKHCLN